jgi:hypothetical protein
MESWTDAAVKFFLRCIWVYRNPVHAGVPETRYIGVYQEPVHTGVPPYIFLPSHCRTNTCAVPPIKNRKCAWRKIFARNRPMAATGRNFFACLVPDAAFETVVVPMYLRIVDRSASLPKSTRLSTKTRCMRVYRKPGTYGCTKNRLHTGVPPYIFLPSHCRTNTCAVPPIKNRKCAWRKIFARNRPMARSTGAALLRKAPAGGQTCSTKMAAAKIKTGHYGSKPASTHS